MQNIKRRLILQQGGYLQYEKKKKYTFDYNDPKQVNSFADILLNAFMPNNPTKQKHKGNALYHLYDLTNIPEILDILKNTNKRRKYEL